MYNPKLFACLSISLLVCSISSFAMEPLSNVPETMHLTIANQSEKPVFQIDSSNNLIKIEPYEDKELVLFKNGKVTVRTQSGKFSLLPNNKNNPEFLALIQHEAGDNAELLMLQKIPYKSVKHLIMIVNPDGSVAVVIKNAMRAPSGKPSNQPQMHNLPMDKQIKQRNRGAVMENGNIRFKSQQ
jgi:hypothetical protein